MNHQQIIQPVFRGVRQRNADRYNAFRFYFLFFGLDFNIEEACILIPGNIQRIFIDLRSRFVSVLIISRQYSFPKAFVVALFSGQQFCYDQLRICRNSRVLAIGHADLIGVSVRRQYLLGNFCSLHHTKYGETVRREGHRINDFPAPLGSVLIGIRFGFDHLCLVVLNMHSLDVMLFRQFDNVFEDNLHVHVSLRFHFFSAADKSDIEITLQGDFAPFLTQRFFRHAAV